MSIIDCEDGIFEPRTDVDALQAVHSFGHIWLVLQNNADKFCDYFNGDWHWDIQPIDNDGTPGIEFVNLDGSGEEHVFTFEEFAAKLAENWPNEFNTMNGAPMSEPIRIQRKRTKGWRMPENTVYVGRGSVWGNPFTIDEYGRVGAVEQFREFIDDRQIKIDIKNSLKGKNLACWCKEGEDCHADVLLEIANS